MSYLVSMSSHCNGLQMRRQKVELDVDPSPMFHDRPRTADGGCSVHEQQVVMFSIPAATTAAFSLWLFPIRPWNESVRRV